MIMLGLVVLKIYQSFMMAPITGFGLVVDIQQYMNLAVVGHLEVLLTKIT